MLMRRLCKVQVIGAGIKCFSEVTAAGVTAVVMTQDMPGQKSKGSLIPMTAEVKA